MSHLKMNNFGRNFLAVVLTCLWTNVNSSNILVVSPVPSTTHFKIGEAIAVGLVNAGHNVTIVTAYDYKPKNMSRIESIQVTGAIEKAKAMRKEIATGHSDGFEAMVADLCNLTLTDPNMKALYNRTYHLVIVEIFATESFLGLAEMFDAPVVAYSPFSASRWTNDLSVLSHIFHPMLHFPDRMEFLDRMRSTMVRMYESIILAYRHHPVQRSVYNFAFPNAKKSYDEARKNVALTFVNSHFSLARPLPYVPNMIEIGGVHVDRRTSALPQTIKQFIETAAHGVVYFSLGSILKSAKLPTDKRNAFVNTFAKFKQRFIWKFEDPTVRMPSNVLAKNWFPQADILGHPNVKAFISHGGLLGSIEAVHHGVPIFGIPFFGDQRLNVELASQTGWAVRLDYDNISASSVEWALNEILKDRYSETARLVSKRYRDQPMSPTDTMVYWSEYIIRHKGAPHLRTQGRLDSNYIQYYNVDVLATIFCIAMLSVYAVTWTMQKICCRKSRPKVKVERKEQ